MDGYTYNPAREPSRSPRVEHDASVIGLSDHGQTATLATGTAIAVEENNLDRGRRADLCIDRALRRSRYFLIVLGNITEARARQRCVWRSRIGRQGIRCSVWTGRRGSIRHGRHRIHVELRK